MPIIALIALCSPAQSVTDQVEGQRYNITYHVAAPAAAPGADACVTARWPLNGSSDSYILRVSAAGSRLLKTTEGRDRLVASSKTLRLPETGQPAAKVLIARRPDRLWIEADGRRAFTLFDRTHHAGEVEVAAEKAAVEGLSVQPLEELAFGDDFLRERGDGDWETAIGDWKLIVYRDPKIAREGGAIEASWFESAGADDNLAVAGYPFWDDYRYGVTCRAGAGGTVGLAFNLRDAENYCRAALTDDGKLEVCRVSEGAVEVVGSAEVGWSTNRWHRLEVVTWDREARVSLNGRQQVSVTGLTPAGGRIGLVAAGPGARFDDAKMTSVSSFWDDFSTESTYRWDVSREASAVSGGALTSTSPSGTTALARTPAWDEYVADCRVGPGAHGAGAVVGWTAPGDYWAFEATGPRGWRLRQRLHGEDRIVSSGNRAKAGAQWDLRVEVGHQLMECFVDGDLVVRHGVAGGAASRLGLIAAGPGARFEHFSAEQRPPLRLPVFATDFSTAQVIGKAKNEVWRVLGDLMVPARGSWRMISADGERRVLGKAGKAPAVLRFRDPVAGDVQATCDFAGAEAAPAVGFVDASLNLQYLARLGSDGKLLELVRGGEVVASVSVPAAEGGETAFPLELERVGRHYAARFGHAGVTYEDDAPLAGDFVAVVAQSGTATLDSLSIRGRNALTYPFDRVEPDWQQTSGEWGFHSGMTCVPWGYWLTGDGRREQAVQWNQHRLPADLDLDFYVSEHTIGEENLDHSHFPYHDISVVLCGDGRNLDSGYRALIGADGRGSRLYRQGEVVATSPSPTIVMGSHCNEPRLIRVHIRRESGKLTVTGNGVTLFDFEDPNPLGAGYLALGVDKCRANFSDLYLAALRTWENQLPSP